MKKTVLEGAAALLLVAVYWFFAGAFDKWLNPPEVMYRMLSIVGIALLVAAAVALMIRVSTSGRSG